MTIAVSNFRTQTLLSVKTPPILTLVPLMVNINHILLIFVDFANCSLQSSSNQNDGKKMICSFYFHSKSMWLIVIYIIQYLFSVVEVKNCEKRAIGDIIVFFFSKLPNKFLTMVSTCHDIAASEYGRHASFQVVWLTSMYTFLFGHKAIWGH